MLIDTFYVESWPGKGWIVTDYRSTYLLSLQDIAAQRKVSYTVDDYMQASLNSLNNGMISLTPENEKLIIKWQAQKGKLKFTLGTTTLSKQEENTLFDWISAVTSHSADLNVIAFNVQTQNNELKQQVEELKKDKDEVYVTNQAVKLLHDHAIVQREKDMITMKKFKNILNQKKFKVFLS
jgi:hypothetical protein